MDAVYIAPNAGAWFKELVESTIKNNGLAFGEVTNIVNPSHKVLCLCIKIITLLTMSNPHYVIIGGGIVGLATAYQLLTLHPHLQLTLLEKESTFAAHQTGHNSGVVHSGIYYKPGSLKAQNCLEGRRELLAFCDTHGIPYQTVSKLIVATRADELPMLAQIEARGRLNGIPALRNIGIEEMREVEPHVAGLRALLLKAQIIHYPTVAAHLAREITRLGGTLHLNQEVTQIEPHQVHTQSASYPYTRLICCAGLHSDRLANAPHRILPFRGEYYELTPSARPLVRGLIYPVPDPSFPFLGVHFTRMIDGTVEAGPNAVLAFAREGYRKSDLSFRDLRDTLTYPGFWRLAKRHFSAGAYEVLRSLSKKLFLRDLQRLIPCLTSKDILPAGSGIRAQAVMPDGKLLDDFSILTRDNQTHVLNAPSPAATASFAIGKHIALSSLK